MIRQVGDGAFAGQPIQFSTYPDMRPNTPAPALGEHTDAVLTELGYSAEEIAAMKAEGVSADPPTGVRLADDMHHHDSRAVDCNGTGIVGQHDQMRA